MVQVGGREDLLERLHPALFGGVDLAQHRQRPLAVSPAGDPAHFQIFVSAHRVFLLGASGL